jgi:prophage regulatory protein
MSKKLTQEKVYTTSLIDVLEVFDSLPDSAHVRLAVMQVIYACSASSIWRMVRSGKLPAPRHLASRISAWRVGDIRENLAAQGGK